MRLLFILLFVIGTKSVLIAQLSLDSLKNVATNSPDDTLKVQTYLKIYYEFHRSNLDSALFYAEKAETLSRKIDFTSGIANSLYRQSTVYRSLSEYSKSEKMLSSAIQYFDETQDSAFLVYSMIDLGRLAQIQNRNDQAISYFQNAIQLAINLKDKNSQARAENYLGQLFKDQKQFDKALQHYREALELVTEIEFQPGISACLTNMAEIYVIQKAHDKAFEYLDRAREMKKEMGDKLGLSRVLLNIAGVHYDLLQHNKAKPYYQEAYEIALDLKQVKQLALATYGLANNSYSLGAYNKSLQYAQEAQPFIEEAKDVSLAVSNSELLGHIYAKLGLFDKSYEFMSIHSTLQDSLYDEAKIALINELEEKYQNEQKAKEIALLESENQLRSLQIVKGENERNYLIAFALVALVLIGLVFNQYRIKQKANNKLRELDRIKTSFFENLSHEFRTPLSLIMAPIREKMATANEKDKKEYQMILNNAEKLLSQINGLLDLAKLEAGGFKLNKSSVEITKFFNAVAASFSSYASSKSIVFHSKLPEEILWLLIDPSVLSQLCNNLLSNALKFTKEGGEVHFKVKYQTGTLTIEVRDNGVGIAKDLQKRVFNRFEQLDQPSIFRQGTGIGLSLVKELAEVQGGSITLNSVPGEGSTFKLVLPVEEGAPQSKAMAEEFKTVALVTNGTESDENSYSSNQRKILLIEDSVDLRNYVSDLIKDSYQVMTASDGKDGLKQATEEIPDLVISDVMMPEMDGIEFCKRLGEQVETDHIPIILLSARADQQTKISGLRKGAIQYMTKPFEPEELKITIENIIHQQARLWEKYTNNENGRTTKSEVHPFTKKCEDIVHAHIDDSEFDMTQFAKEVGMSRMQLHRKLISLTNLSSTAFIRYHRLIKAKELLEAGEHTSQVAYAVGFSSLSYFSTSFKMQFGKSPSEYSTIP